MMIYINNSEKEDKQAELDDLLYSLDLMYEQSRANKQ